MAPSPGIPGRVRGWAATCQRRPARRLPCSRRRRTFEFNLTLRAWAGVRPVALKHAHAANPLDARTQFGGVGMAPGRRQPPVAASPPSTGSPVVRRPSTAVRAAGRFFDNFSPSPVLGGGPGWGRTGAITGCHRSAIRGRPLPGPRHPSTGLRRTGDPWHPASSSRAGIPACHGTMYPSARLARGVRTATCRVSWQAGMPALLCK